MTEPKHIGIIGAGLVGSLLSIYLSRRGYRVSVYERREDLRKQIADEGRSINLALSTRGIRALEAVGLEKEIKAMAIPMTGRMMHDLKGNLSFLAYGKQGQFINSVSRGDLNRILIEKAEENNVRFYFNHRCIRVDPDQTTATFQAGDKSEIRTFDQMIGADGAFSAVRTAMQFTDRYNYSQHYLQHGYKELHIPAAGPGKFALERNALHIWPRESFMMIALPNPDGSFTCTLFFPFEGPASFGALKNDRAVLEFFKNEFPDALDLMPNLVTDYHQNPTGSLVTIKCFPWVMNKTVLIGDAAHAIVPFYGQGMNAGFEDCRILDQLLDHHSDQWPQALQEFQSLRKKDTDAIAELAFQNFTEMRDLVADPEFLLRKKIEAKLHDLFPDKWIPLYSMVTFSEDISYAQAQQKGKKQERIMDAVMRTPNIEECWEKLDFEEIASRLS